MPFEQNHETMRAASMRSVSGPASIDQIAANVHEPIPGERDPGNLTARQPGAASSQFTGQDIPQDQHPKWLDEITATEHEREGGGSPRRIRPG